MTGSLFTWLTWGGGVALAALLLVRMMRLRLARQYPCFTAYLAWQVLRSVPGMMAYTYSLNYYFSVYWLQKALSWVLMFLVILELFDRVLGPYSGIRRVARLWVVWSAIGLTTAVSLVVTSAVDIDPRYWIAHWLNFMLRSVSVVQAGLLLLLVFFVFWFRVRLVSLLRYLVWGWLLLATLSVMVAALRSQLGVSFYSVMLHVEPLLYIAVLLVWCRAIRVSAEVPQERPSFAMAAGGEALALRKLQLVNESLVRAFHV
jgi:hypothetical protein